MARTAWFRHVDRSTTLDSLPEPTSPHDVKDDTVIMEVMRLPGKYREVILLYYYQGMRAKEIAKILSLPQPTVSSRLKRAKNRLQKRLERWYFDE
jgi:RNA polymerase sigma-70 factor (ECF subfamily)